MYKTISSFFIILILLLIAGIMPVMAAEEGERIETSGEISAGGQQVWNNDANSSKFNEYRDIEDGAYLYRFEIEGVDNEKGRYLELKGSNISRDDQNLIFRLGGYSTWGFEAEWDEIPHNISNKAKTPYNYQSGGLYTISGNAGITSITDPTNLFDDVATFLNNTAPPHLTDLGTQREKGSATLRYTPLASLNFTLKISDERKEGTIITGAPLGDRPPNTVNVQLPEPVDYTTKEIKFTTEYSGEKLQAEFSYLLSEFENDVKSLTWQSMFYGAGGGGTDYNDLDPTASTKYVSTYGETALYPDNRYQNIALSLGFNLPLESRLTATASYGLMEQDDALLPYSYSAFTGLTGAPDTLPRTTADAEIETIFLNLHYTINPIDRLNLKVFYRDYKLDNNTAKSQWKYETSDTLITDTGIGLNNWRVNLPYSYDKQNYGLDAYYSIWRSTLGLGYERENIDRDYREADTEEDMFKASVNYRPVNWLALRAKYLYSERDGGSYNGEVTDQSYWYTGTDSLYGSGANTKDNPVANFGNSPDLRKSDVSDRERNQWEVSAIVSPMDTVNINLSYMHRKDDFDSNVTPTAVAGYNSSTGAITNYNTVGQQLGLLENEIDTYSAEVNYIPIERLNLSLNYGREENKSFQRGNGASEDEKFSGTGWTDPTKLWTADITDKTDTYGVGAGFVIIPEKLNFAAGYSYSYGTVAIDYSGYGSDQALTTYYAFNDPETVSHKQHTLNASLEYQMLKNWIIGLSYLYDKYKIKDWMQEPSGGWAGSSGSEYYLIDSTTSTTQDKWGSSLVSMGSYLGPSYEAHVGFLTVAYKW